MNMIKPSAPEIKLFKPSNMAKKKERKKNAATREGKQVNEYNFVTRGLRITSF